MRLRVPEARRQRGLAMIAVLTLIALLSAYLIADRMGSISSELRSEREKLTVKALQDAKTALLGHVAKTAANTASAVPGRLPCYEDAEKIGETSEGEEAPGGTCNTNTIIQFGRLPWKTVSLGDIRDGWGEKLWYVLSPGFRDQPINSTTAGQLMLDGKPVVALIIAPGPPINSQSRPALPDVMSYDYFSSASVYANYLEDQNATSPVDVNFTSAGQSETFNDRVIAITQREVFDVVTPIVAARLERGTDDLFPESIDSYYAVWNAYPLAAPFGDPTTSDYRGVASMYQGLTPATTTSGDPSFVTWVSPPAPVITNNNGTGNGTVNSQSCGPTGTQSLVCDFRYRRSSGKTPTVSITATIQNVGMAFRDKIESYGSPGGPSISSGVMTNTSLAQSLDAAGNAIVTFSAKLPNLGSGWKNVSITIPVPGDNAVLTHWYFTNQWYRSAYYAIAPAYAPHTQPYAPSCGSCITVTDASSGAITASNKMVMILMGSALGQHSQPSSSVADYLDGANGTNAQSGTLSFLKSARGGSSNDLAISLQ